MKLTINGQTQDKPDGLSVAGLLDNLKMNPSLVAVEINRRLVPRSRHGETAINDGDVLEIVTLAGGG